MQLSRLPPRSVAFGVASTAWRLATSRGMAAFGLAAVRVERLKGVQSSQGYWMTASGPACVKQIWGFPRHRVQHLIHFLRLGC
jgi:hypothetical protein